MGHRLTRAWRALEERIRIAPDAESNKIFALGYRASDFVAQILDIRIRIILCVEAKNATDLRNTMYLGEARALLEEWPATTAVALVANDAGLSTVIVEPITGSDGVGVPSGSDRVGRTLAVPMSIHDAISEYLDARLRDWPDLPPRGLDTPSTTVSDLSLAAAEAAIAEVHHLRPTIPERLSAFRALGANDAQWVVGLVGRLVSRKITPRDIADEIERRSRDHD